ncbi:glutamate--tRNA ligase [candidate division TA06 bacterium B3_TA06]|uniref:Glutamate--tRNA ligase n=1 Tax=candidate division TA06 bacterium B3_TA06 TaxID=2012487 RepID=A0A532V033_UNCT6|nr:MAG: glutamate--tRNA ligase [candidate division TA06 bacterium B3_TA06]
MSEERSKVRVRIAPSPTGAIHVGLARSALYNYLFACSYGGTFVLRIEDTDVERSTEESAQAIIRGLGWLGITFDEGPYYQSQRMDIYQEYAEKLIASGHAYKCYCTPERLEAERKKADAQRRAWRYDRRCLNLTEEQKKEFEAEGIKPAIRFLVPEGKTTFTDLIHGSITREHKDIDDFVIVRSNGIPTYNFAVVADDHLMEISHVLRAVEHISNTTKQILLYQAFGWEIPAFAHLPLILGEDKKKLSKRHGAMSLEEFRRMGYLADAMVNFLALLGWSPGGDREIISRQELVALFSLERINTSNAIFDMKKLEWMNGEYLRAMGKEELLKVFQEWLDYQGITLPREYSSPDFLSKVLPLIAERSRTLAEVYDALLPYVCDDLTYDEEGLNKHFRKDPEAVKRWLLLYRERLEKLHEFNKETAEQVLRELVEELGIKAGEIIHPVRIAVTGRTVGPPLFNCLELLGRERVLERLANLPE